LKWWEEDGITLSLHPHFRPNFVLALPYFTIQINGKQGTAFLGKPNVLSLRHHIQLQQISSKLAESL
jgi:hypothetical protein